MDSKEKVLYNSYVKPDRPVWRYCTRYKYLYYVILNCTAHPYTTTAHPSTHTDRYSQIYETNDGFANRVLLCTPRPKLLMEEVEESQKFNCLKRTNPQQLNPAVQHFCHFSNQLLDVTNLNILPTCTFTLPFLHILRARDNLQKEGECKFSHMDFSWFVAFWAS